MREKLGELIEEYGSMMALTRGGHAKARIQRKQAIIDYVECERGKAYQKTYDEAYGKGYNFAKGDATKNIREALGKAIAVLYFDDSSDYSGALWKIVELLGGEEAVDLLANDERQAYKKYAEDEEGE